MATYYLFLDTETGGLDAKTCSLLSLSLLLCNEDGNEISHLDLYLRPDDGVYHVTPDALRINKIDLTDQSDVISYTQARNDITSFLGCFNKGNFLIPVGWNLPFDLEFIYEQLFNKRQFQSLVNSYKLIDVASIWLYLKAMGKINSGGNRLIDAAQVLDIPILSDQYHIASVDTSITKDVFLKLKDYLK